MLPAPLMCTVTSSTDASVSCVGMAEVPSEPHRGASGLVGRRHFLAAAAGLAAAVGACTSRAVSAAATEGSTPAHLTAGPPRLVTPTAPPLAPPQPTGTSATMLCRDSWGARPALPGGQPHTITRMTLHHTAVVLGDNSNAPGRLRQHQRYHQDQKGWIDIAYHVGVDRDGNIFELRTPEIAGDTATTYNPVGHFLVLCEGDFDQEAVTDAQLNGAAIAFAWGAQTFGVPTATLAGHRDFADTTCPGAGLYDQLATGSLKARVDDVLAAGPVDLKLLCGPEAAAIVAGIEGG